jgi:hypothetical protein
VYIFNDEADAQKTLSEINTEMFLMTPFYFTVYDEILNKKYFLLKPDTYKYLKLN